MSKKKGLKKQQTQEPEVCLKEVVMELDMGPGGSALIPTFDGHAAQVRSPSPGLDRPRTPEVMARSPRPPSKPPRGLRHDYGGTQVLSTQAQVARRANKRANRKDGDIETMELDLGWEAAEEAGRGTPSTRYYSAQQAYGSAIHSPVTPQKSPRSPRPGYVRQDSNYRDFDNPASAGAASSTTNKGLLKSEAFQKFNEKK